MVKIAVPFPIFALLVAGCFGWPPAEPEVHVYNETDAAATVEVVLFAEDGGIAHQDIVSVGPHATAEGKKVKVPAGTYRIEARSGPWALNETNSLGRSTPEVGVYVTADGLDIRVPTV